MELVKKHKINQYFFVDLTIEKTN
jgi:hypothetical protein